MMECPSDTSARTRGQGRRASLTTRFFSARRDVWELSYAQAKDGNHQDQDVDANPMSAAVITM